MNAVIPFAFGDNLIRTLVLNESPWFVVVDICGALGLGNATAAVRNLDDADLTTGKVSSQSGSKSVNICNESGLYQLIFQSRKEGARKFKRWVTNEVLPAIRKTGSYTAPGAAPALTSPSERVLELIRAGVSPEGAERLVLADQAFLGAGSPALVEEVSHGRMLARMENPMERAETIGELSKAMGIVELTKELGCHRSFVYRHLVILKLSPQAQEAVRTRQISLRAANFLAKLDAKRQLPALKTACEKKFSEREAVTYFKGAAPKKRKKAKKRG